VGNRGLTIGTHCRQNMHVEDWDFVFDPAKNELLKRERSISFEQIISLIESGKLIQVLQHPDENRYPNQLLFEVDVDGYVYVVPGVREGNTVLLKTIFPSRKATKQIRKGVQN
jgi:hypothetical protein